MVGGSTAGVKGQRGREQGEQQVNSGGEGEERKREREGRWNSVVTFLKNTK